MNPLHLKTFLAVAAEGSFSRAARIVHVSQSTASVHVRQLEETLGTRLLEREPEVRPTTAGRVLIRYASRLLHLQQEAEQQVRRHSEAEAGELTIGAEHPAAEEHLPSLLASFHRACPHVRVTVQSCSTAAATAALLAGDCDLAFLQGPLDNGDLVSVPIARTVFVVVGAPDRASDRFVTCPPPVGPALPEGARASIRMASTWGARRCVLEGAGLALLPSASVEEDIRAGRLEVVPWEGTPRVRVLLAARPAAAPLTEPARALLDLVTRA